MQEKLELLLKKYSVPTKAVLSSDGKTVMINGESFPILPWEAERRFIEMRGLVTGGRVGSMCTYRIGHTAAENTDLFELLRREIGILEFTLDSDVCEIFAIAGQHTMNCIAETKNGCVCTVELAATLENEIEAVDKHEIITDNGVACDRAVDTQVPQSSIYVFGKNQTTYRDTDAELYGCSEEEIHRIRYAFSLAKSEEARKAAKEKARHSDAVIDAAKQSLATLENRKVGE